MANEKMGQKNASDKHYVFFVSSAFKKFQIEEKSCFDNSNLEIVVKNVNKNSPKNFKDKTFCEEKFCSNYPYLRAQYFDFSQKADMDIVAEKKSFV